MFPNILDTDTVSGVFVNNTDPWLISYPPVAAGDLLLLIAAIAGAVTVTTPADWTMLVTEPNVTTMLWTGAKEAVGSETGDITLNLSGAERGCYAVYRIAAGSWVTSGDLTVDVPALSQGSSSANPHSPLLDPSWSASADTLWLISASKLIGVGDATIDAAPVNYTDFLDLSSGNSDGANLGVARRLIAEDQESPGAFTGTGSTAWAASTLAVQGATVASVVPGQYVTHHIGRGSAW